MHHRLYRHRDRCHFWENLPDLSTIMIVADVSRSRWRFSTSLRLQPIWSRLLLGCKLQTLTSSLIWQSLLRHNKTGRRAPGPTSNGSKVHFVQMHNTSQSVSGGPAQLRVIKQTMVSNRIILNIVAQFQLSARSSNSSCGLNYQESYSVENVALILSLLPHVLLMKRDSNARQVWSHARHSP